MADLKEEKTLYNSGGQNVTTDLSYEGYTEKWRDEFNSTELDRDNWNVELHEPGWVNAELQEYVDSKENIIVKDGKLILKAIKAKNEKGEYVYTSGRVNTQGKQDYKYGIFEAEIKVPEGKGFLPAFWMMPTNEGLYGQWPKCGEIDIMEIMCHDTKTSYGTLHYGVPHKENQGMRTLEDGDFSKEFHKFSCKWEPGKITWYIDGHHLYETSDWYSKTTAGSEMTYPAPFDQPFYMILNLAVGGSWVGYPDESTSFEKAELVINSVRVYQKDDGYDENVKKPVQDNVKEPVKPEVPAGGNYVCNGKFQEGEGRLAFWNVSEGSKVYVTNLLEETGKKGAAKYRVVRKFVATGNAVLSQTELGLRADTAYALSFKADATKESIVKFSVTGEIVKEVKIPVSDKMTEYTAKFRTSLNPQNQDLKIEITSEGEVYLDEIYIMEDTLIKNGSFNADFTGFETFVDESAAAVFSIDELNNGGKKTPTIEIEDTADKEWKIQLKQTGVKLEKGKCYKLSFKAKSTLDRTIQYTLQRDGSVHKNADGGEDWTPYTQETVSVTRDYQTFEKKFKMTFDSDEGTIFNISMGGKNITDKHVISIDDIELVEIPESEMPKVEAGENLLKNADFAKGSNDWNIYFHKNEAEVYVATGSAIVEGKSVVYDIKNVGTDNWHVQLKQSGIKLVNGKKYKVSVKVKSTKARKINVALQNSGGSKNYDRYQGSGRYITENETVIEYKFTASEDVGNADFVISMGQMFDYLEDKEPVKINTPASTITLSDFSIVEVTE